MFGFNKTSSMETKSRTQAREVQEMFRAAVPRQEMFLLQDPNPRKYAGFLTQYTNWVYTCASRNAATVASVPLRLYSPVSNSSIKQKLRKMGRTKAVSKDVQKYINTKSHLVTVLGGREVEEIIVHPWLDLIREVNDFTNGFEMIELMVTYLELTGNAYWHIILDSNNIPTELWTLPSQLVSIKKSNKTGIDAYIFGSQQPLQRIETEVVAHFKYPNPLDIYYGLGPLEATLGPVTLNTRFGAYENAVLENGAIIPFFLSTDETLNEDAVTRLRAMINTVHRGWKKAGTWGLLTGGMKPTQVGNKLKDINYKEGLELTKEQICAAFGIPVSKVSQDGVSKANAAEGDHQYMKETILPKLKRIEQVINQDIMPFYDKELFVAFDNPVPSDRKFDLEESDTRLGNNSATINEVREHNGEDPVEWGDEPLVQGDWHPLSEVPEPIEITEPFPDEEEEDVKGRRVTKVQTLTDGSPTASISIQTHTEKWLNTTSIVAAGSVSNFLISDPSIVINSIPWTQIETAGIEELSAPLTQVLHAGAKRGVSRMRKLKIEVDAWDVKNPFAIQWAEKYVGDRITLITTQTRLAVREAVVDALKQGKNSDQLQRVVQQHIGLNDRQSKALTSREVKLRVGGASEKSIAANVTQYRRELIKQRAEMIARTETAAAWAEGNIASYKDAGVMFKEFSAASDACKICWPLDGNVYPIGSSEQVIPKHNSCRCDWLPVIETPVINEPQLVG